MNFRLILYFVLIFVFVFSCKGKTKDQENQPFNINESRGYALLVGVSKTKVKGYDYIYGVENNITRVSKILKKRDFEKPTVLIDLPKAKEITDELLGYINNLRDQDLFVFYFFGHGDQVEDDSNDEIDGQDEFLVANDSIILDDRINDILRKSNTKGRIVFIIESCHSGSMHQVNGNDIGISEQLIDNRNKSAMPNFIYMGATTDLEEAPIFLSGGIYTSKLSWVWKNAKGSKLNYEEFNAKLKKRLKVSPVFISEYAKKSFLDNKFLTIEEL